MKPIKPVKGMNTHPTKAERLARAATDRETKAMHALGHEFQGLFGDTGNWKYKGHEMMEKVEEWAKHHKEVKVAYCDDGYFSSSTIVLVPHRCRTRSMGVSMYIIPQTTGEDPMRVFLYPNHKHSLLKALKSVKP